MDVVMGVITAMADKMTEAFERIGVSVAPEQTDTAAQPDPALTSQLAAKNAELEQMRRELEQLRLSLAQNASQQKPDFGNELLPELDWDDEGDSSEDDSEMDWEKEGDLFAEGIAAEIDWEEEPLDDMSEDELAWMDDDVETTDEELESEDGNTEEEDYEDFDLAAFVDLSVRNLQALSFVERMRREGKQTSEISLSELMEYLDKKKEEAKEIA